MSSNAAFAQGTTNIAKSRSLPRAGFRAVLVIPVLGFLVTVLSQPLSAWIRRWKQRKRTAHS